MEIPGQIQFKAKKHSEILMEISTGLKNAPRQGADEDNPEGSRCIIMSDTCANIICEHLESIATFLKTAL